MLIRFKIPQVIVNAIDLSFIATGALIDHLHVLTVAHKVNQA
jgi:hypothetical protein